MKVTAGMTQRCGRLLRILAAGALLLSHAQRADAQHGDLDTTFLTGTGANDTVRSLIELSSGKILIAGDFTSYNGTLRNRVALLNADGTLDTAFDPGSGVNGTVYKAVSVSGRYILVGDFTAYNGTTVGNIVMINSNGSFYSGFQVGSGANGSIRTISRVEFSDWLIGGEFSSFNGQARGNFARLSSSGSLNTSTTPSANGAITSIVPEPGSYPDEFIVSGNFTTFGSRTGLTGVAKVGFYGYADSYFRPQVSGGSVNATAYTADSYTSGSLTFIAGDFKKVGNLSLPNFAAINSYGEPDPYVAIFPNGPVHALSVSPSFDQALIAGAFTEVNGIPMKGIARITKRSFYQSGYGTITRWELDQDFGGSEGPNAAVHSVIGDSQGRYLVGGDFTEVGMTSRNGVTRLLSRFGLSLPEVPANLIAEPISGDAIRLVWGVSANGGAYRLERSPDGIADWVEIEYTLATSYISSGLLPETEYHFRVRAVNANGTSAYSVSASATTTATWTGPGSVVAGTPGTAFSSSSVYGSAVQPGGKILICGYFTNVLGVSRKYVARLNADRSLDTGFDAGNLLTSLADLVAVAPDGKIYVVSNGFSDALGFGDYEILRLNPDGTHDPSFTPPASSYDIECIEIDQQGRVLLGLSTQTFGSIQTGSLIRLNADGSMDQSFSVSPSSSLYSIGQHSDRRIVAAGFFSTVNGSTKRSIMRCDPAGILDTAVGNSTSISSIYAVEALPDGSIIIAGTFSTVYGETRSRVAKLKPDGTLDPTFLPPEINSTVSAMERLYDGRILIIGSFTTVGGKYMPRVACLDENGAVEPGFRIGVGANSTVYSASMSPDGSLILTGAFSTFDSKDTDNIVFLNGFAPSSGPVSPGLATAGVGTGSIEISWSNQESEFSYYLETSANGIDGWGEVASFQRDSLSYLDTGLAPGFTRFYRVRASNGLGTSSYSNVISARTWTRFQSWNVDNGYPFDTAVDADGDNDGMGQLMEYGLGLEPDKPDAEGALSSQLIGGNLVLTYYRTRPELHYQVEVSDDLSGWTTEGVSVFHGNFSMGWAPVVQPSRFLRLSISE